MADPISEQIIENVVTTLQGITVANGYQNTVTEVVRPDPAAGTASKNLSLIVFQGSLEPVDWSNQSGREWRHQIKIQATVVESELSSTSIDQRINSIRADIEKSLLVDYQRGNRAITTEILAPDIIQDDLNANEGRIIVNIEVQYRTLWNDPYTLQ